MSQYSGPKHKIVTFGHGRDDSFKTLENDGISSFHMGEVIPVEKGFNPKISFGHQTSRNADGCFVSGCIDIANNLGFLCTDPFGLHPLYLLTIEDGIVFSSSLDVLIRSGFKTLTLDETGICQFIHFDYCLGSRTFYHEIKRFEQGMELRYDIKTDTHSWNKHYEWPVVKKDILENEVAIPLLKDGIIDSIKRRISGRENIVCLLSSGFDSRAISSTLHQLGVKFSTYTTYGDEGRMVDPKGAELVSAALKVSNHFYDLPQDYIQSYWKEKAVTINHETRHHTWLMPMSRQLPECAFNLDGLGGDKLITTPSPINHEYLWKLVEGDWDGMVESMFTWFWPGWSINRLLKDEHLDKLKEELFDSFVSEINKIEPTPHQYLIFILRNHTRRAIGCSPTLLLSQKIRNSTPFYDKKFIELCFRIDERIKFRRRLYKALVDDIAPFLADTPSSHDAEWPEHIMFERRERYLTATPEPLESYLEEIRNAPEIIAKFLNHEWLELAEEARDAKPEQRLQFIKEAQAFGEVCFAVRKYFSFIRE